MILRVGEEKWQIFGGNGVVFGILLHIMLHIKLCKNCLHNSFKVMNVKAVQKKEIVYKNGHSPLFLRFTHERRNKFITLGVSVLPEHWDNESQTAKPNCPDYSVINKLIKDKQNVYW